MTDKEMFTKYCEAGFTKEAACAMMGNIKAESRMNPSNVEDSSPYSDAGYVFNPYDGWGYGLCQWTFWSRKLGLQSYALDTNRKIDDPYMQVEFSIYEMKHDFNSVFNACCTSTDMFSLTKKICHEYERPAVENVQERFGYAKDFYEKFSDVEIPNIPNTGAVSYFSKLRKDDQDAVRTFPLLFKGCTGIYVKILQVLLRVNLNTDLDIDGDFGNITHEAVLAWQSYSKLDTDALVGKETWASFFAK